MAELNTGALLDFADVLDGGQESKGGAKVATVARIDNNGVAYVKLPGGVDETPLADTGAALSVGDTVNVRIEGGKLRAVYNSSNPAVSATYVAPIAERARLAQQYAENADTTANEARKVAEAIDQHFWADDNGVHVTEAENDATTEHNILINSLGILLRKAANNLVSITQNAIAFFDGLGNSSSNIVAQFGADGVQIGKVDESHVELDYHSMKLIDKESNTYFHVSDLRDAEGYLTETFVADGSTWNFDLMTLASSVDYVNIDDTLIDPNQYDVGPYMTEGGLISRLHFFSFPSSGSVIEVRYMSAHTTLVKAYTLGQRRSSGAVGLSSFAEGNLNVASGVISHAEGEETVASGWVSHAEGSSTTSSNFASHAEGNSTTASGRESHAEGYSTEATGITSHAEGDNSVASGGNSHAQNYRTIAASNNQTALGKYNVEDANDVYAVIVGNGTSDSSRSNALTVDWSGNVECAGNLTLCGHSSVVGTTVSNSVSSVSVSTSSAKNILTVSLPKGTWIVFGTIEFAANSSGRRVAALSDTSADIGGINLNFLSTATPVSATRVKVHGVVSPSATTTYYLVGWQNSGSTLSCRGRVDAIRIV